MTPSLSRRRFVQGAGALAASWLWPRDQPAQPLQAPAPTASLPPNVLVILADDLGWGDLACTGHPYVQTPNLDRLAQQGTRFSQFYTASPVCSPSRAGFLTGHFPARHRIYGVIGEEEHNHRLGQADWLDAHAPTLARVFQQAGYATAHIGKWHLGSQNGGAPLPAEYGFNYTRTLNQGWDTDDPVFSVRSTDLMVDEIIRFVEAHPGQPWYVNLALWAVHAPINPPPEDLALYRDLVVSPDDFQGYMPAYLAAAPDLNNQMRTYCAAVTAMDRALGRLLDYLDRNGLAGNTIVVFSSDNGPDSYDKPAAANAGVGNPGPFRGRKGELFDGGVRTPLIVRWPGQVPAGRVDETSVLGAVDLMPTLAALTGALLPAGYRADGEDVSDIWHGAERPRLRPLCWVHGVAHKMAVRAGSYKMILGADRIVLYDLATDPEERQNLVRKQIDVAGDLFLTLIDEGLISRLFLPLVDRSE